jgi:aryl-alcohol dehydrogenase-like predicted oxidoreductase
LQPEYNLYDRAGFEQKLEAVCVKHGLGVISYFSLASGFLSGKYQSAEAAGSVPRAGMLKKYFNERGTRILESLDEVAREVKAKPAQVALAWVMARPSITAPIASATKVEQLKELVEATRLELPGGMVERLNQASAVESMAAYGLRLGEQTTPPSAQKRAEGWGTRALGRKDVFAGHLFIRT